MSDTTSGLGNLTIVDRFRSESPEGEEQLAKFLESNFLFRCRGHRKTVGDWDQSLIVRQDPREVAKFLLFLTAKNVRSYAEIGVARGGFYYLVDSYLRWQTGGHVRSVAIDIKDGVVGMDSYVEKYPGAEFRLCNRFTPCPLSGYDLIFIDTNERRMKKYLILYGPSTCRFLGFDDTHDSRWGACKIQCDHDFWRGGKGPGIGVIDWSQREAE